MKYKGQHNIITDTDITMTGQLIGHSLSEVIDSQQSDIDALKSNVKWIYKYGGVGSGGSGGGGSSENTAPWNFRVELDDAVRVSGSTVNLGKLKEYKLTVSLYKVKGRTFTIKYTYTTETGIKITEKVISPNQSPILTDFVNLLVNGTLTVAINDDEGNTALFVMDYIVSAYNFTINYAVSDGTESTTSNNIFVDVPPANYVPYFPNNNNIFVSDVQSGLVIDLYCTIAVDIIDGAIIEYTDWDGTETKTYPLKKGSYHIYLPVGKEINNNNSGNYSFIVNPHLILSGNSEEEKIESLKLIDNLIPSTIYLKVESDGIIYLDKNSTTPYLFYSGVTPFYVTPFLGYLDNSSSYSIQVYLNGELQDVGVTSLQDLLKYTINVLTDRLGWNDITFIINRKGDVYRETYHIYTKSALGSFNWYPEYTLNGISTRVLPAISYQYKYAHNKYDHENVKLFTGLNKSTLINYTPSTNTKTYEVTIAKENASYDCLISIGVDYSNLNDITKCIFEISGNDSVHNIQIFQNKIKIGDNISDNFYLPLSTNSYHLISLYRRAVSASGNTIYFEWTVYIDGVIETSVPKLITIQECYNKITLNGGLYSVNYLEISYFNHTKISDNTLDILLAYNPDPNKYPISYLNDSAILYHYYSYKLTYYPESISDTFKNVYSFVSQFYYDYKTGRTVVSGDLIQKIAQEVDLPVLLINYTEPRTDTNDWNSIGKPFMDWMETRYDVTTNTNILNISHTVDVSYSPGKRELKNISLEKYPNATFKLYLLGTSTLNYKSKNFDLAIESAREDITYLYSPNFKDNDYTTFLPEKRFTIKGDVVDSSHSNNNAIGKFINTVCTKFAEAQQKTNATESSKKYSNYIKNALEGFPVLLFIQNSYYENATIITPKSDYYFIGISNMNLGRDSEFNLGYKDLRILPETIENGFAVTEINHNNTTLNVDGYLNNFAVAEIRENRNYFDFSQSDPSFLFEIEGAEDNDYMFSKFKSNNQDILKSSLQAAVEGVSKGGGYIFEKLGKNMLSTKKDTDTFGYGYDEGYKSDLPQNLVPNYSVKLKRTFENSTSVLTPTGETIKGELANLIATLIGKPEEGIQPLIDYKALSEYYVICMALGLLDSVMKNLNLKKWDTRFYPSFYDMDTSLGKDNAGNNSNYICFSDYWEPKTSSIGGFTKLQPATSYKDWFDKNVIGFDVPMTYLFALAKYGYQFAEFPELEDWYPNNLWARFRRSNKNISGWTAPAGTNNNHIGCLESADKFIDDFFKNHLNSVPDVFFNINYRNKYLLVESGNNVFVTEEYKKLSGRRINYVRDWLNSRFHLLDLYFNLASVSDSILTYDMKTETWNTTPNSSYKLPNANFIDTSNKDIIILKDIFSSGEGSTKYSSNVNITFTADDYSPLCLSGAAIARYITEDNTTNYLLQVESTGKALNLGGSSNWLTINSINSLIQGNSFYVQSDKLTTLNGNEGTCSAWAITLPSLKSVSLTSPGYSGILGFSSTEAYPNLNSINISKSKLGLNLNQLNITEIIAKDVQIAAELKINNCTKVKTLNIENSIFSSIELTPINSVSYFSTYKYEKNNNGEWLKTGTLANSAKCKTLSLSRKSYNDGIVFISDQTFKNGSIDEGLTELTLEGYKEIYIDNCPFLSKIIINNPELLEHISITNSSNSATSLQINSNTLNTIDLRAAKKLKDVDFKSTKKFQYVYLPANTQLKSNAFYQTNIKYLSGDSLKLNTNVFNLAGSFTLLLNDGETLCSFDKTLDITDLSYVFYMTKVSKETFDLFNSTYGTLLNNVKVVDCMWAYSPCVDYNEEDLLQDIAYKKGRFNLSMYTNVTSAKGMLGGRNTTACHPNTFNGFGANASSIDITNFYVWSELSGLTVTLPYNWLGDIKNKVTKCSNTIDSVTFKVVDSEGTLLSEFKPKLLFGTNIDSLENWVFHEEHTIDFENAFNETNFPNLKTIKKSFCGCKAKNLLYIENESEYGLFYKKSIQNVLGSFGFTNYNEITIDLSKYLNWENLDNYKGFLYIKTWDEKYHVLEFNKTISSLSVFNSIYEKLITKYSALSLSHVFLNCIVTRKDSEDISFGTNKNTIITKIPYLFTNFKMDDDSEVYWDWNIMQTLPSIQELQYTFSGISFNGNIPFNFFKTRKINQNGVKVFTKQDLEFTEAKLYTFKYDLRITDLSHCFEKCKFSVHTFIPSQLVKDINNINSMSYLTDIDGNPLDITKYYSTNSLFESEKIILNTEFDDMYKKVAYSSNIITVNDNGNVLVRDTVNGRVQTYENYPLLDGENLNNPFISPDFFYACKDSVKLDYCFADCDLLGYIPDNLLKNCKNANLSNFIKDVLILPKKYMERYSVNFDKYFDIYYYIGSNFCTNLNLNNAFNFRIALPSSSSEVKLLHVFCFSDSFNRNLEEANNIMPVNINSIPTGLFFALQEKDNNTIFINPMYDKASEREIIYEKDEEGNNITMDSAGNPIQVGSIIGNLGFDLSKYNRLYADYLINNLFVQFTYGNLFDEYTTLYSIKKKSDNSWAIRCGNDRNDFGISNNAIWPTTLLWKSKIINTGHISHLFDGEKYVYTTGVDLKIFKTNVNSYNEDIPTYYNNSRYNMNGYGLQFI